MAAKLSKKDLGILIALTEYRIMTVRQLEVLYPGNGRVLREKLKKYAERKLVHRGSSAYAGGRGRPADVFSIGQNGFELLRTEKKLKTDIPYERVKEISAHSMGHMLAINDFRIQLVQAEKILPDLAVTFLSPNSPFIKEHSNGKPIVHERFPVDTTDTKWVGYTPDGVFVMRCTKTKKTLLFYLEVDMSTESLVSGKGHRSSIQEKIINYQLTYQFERYKRYESIFQCRFQGFRLLFVTSSLKSLVNISKLAAQMPPTEFIYITDIESLHTKGLWSAIWHKGGRLDMRPVSILGSKSPKSPLKPNEIA